MEDRTVPTWKQIEYVRALQRRLHLPDRMLEDHCRARFAAPFAALTRSQVSDLIDEMAGWTAIPAELQIAGGQSVLPGVSL